MLIYANVNLFRIRTKRRCLTSKCAKSWFFFFIYKSRTRESFFDAFRFDWARIVLLAFASFVLLLKTRVHSDVYVYNIFVHLGVPVHAIVRTLSRVWCSVSIRVSDVGATDVLYQPAFIYSHFFIFFSHPRIRTFRILTSRDELLTDSKIRTSSYALSLLGR